LLTGSFWAYARSKPPFVLTSNHSDDLVSSSLRESPIVGSVLGIELFAQSAGQRGRAGGGKAAFVSPITKPIAAP
jgi:hypothetical protein